MLEFKDKLSLLEKITNTDAINTASNPHREAQTLAREVLLIWTNEILIKPTKSALFK
jgi:hypothetical protein